MRHLTELFTRHPATVDETYAQHMAMSFGFAVSLALAAGAAAIHAILPFLFEKTASRMIATLHSETAHRGTKAE